MAKKYSRRSVLFIFLAVVILAASTLVLQGCSMSSGAANEVIIDKDHKITQNFIKQSDYTYDGEPLGSVQYIAVHYTANPKSTAIANRNYFNSLADGHGVSASAHFIIGLDGEIIQCVPLEYVSWANGNMESNRHSITIECCHPDESGKFNDATLASLRALVKWLCEKYSLGEDALIRHYDVTGKLCPLYFVEHPDEWQAFKDSVFDNAATEANYHTDFFLRWGVFGISSYDSKTGVLIKTTDVIEHSPDDYKTALTLSNTQRLRIDELLNELDIESYPDEYDPYLADDGTTIETSPSTTIVLTVGGKTVACRGVSLGGPAGTEKGKNFLDTIDEITSIITSSNEWRSLPGYEVLYD